jgi:hypothetical protein
MQILGCDIFHHAGQWYSCIVDYHTAFPWIKLLKNQEAEQVIAHFQEVCNLFGYPSEVVSDRGTQYTSSEFQSLCLQFNIIHKPATPHSQWKNGRCENTIGRLKRLLEKSKEEEVTMEDIVLNIRDTPIDNKIPSPYELMFKRKVKTDLPMIPLSLFEDSSSIQAGHRSVKHAEYTNDRENRVDPNHLEEDQNVLYLKKPQDKKAKWNQGTVVSVDGFRSYTIQDDNTGATYSRDRKHVKPSSKDQTLSESKEDQGSVTSSPPIKQDNTAQDESSNMELPKDSITNSRPKRDIRPPKKYDDFVTKLHSVN